MKLIAIPLNKDTKVLLIKSNETKKFISELEKICVLTVITETKKNITHPHGSIGALHDAYVAINGEAVVIKNKITGQFFKVKEVSHRKLLGN